MVQTAVSLAHEEGLVTWDGLVTDVTAERYLLPYTHVACDMVYVRTTVGDNGLVHWTPCVRMENARETRYVLLTCYMSCCISFLHGPY